MESSVKSRAIENRIIIGIACITATIILVGWIAINENARMEEFTERAQGRSVEQGALLFEDNCASCHGYTGLGTVRAPALNNPVLFGYNFLSSVNDEQLAIDSQLKAATDPDEITRLQNRLAELDAEEQALTEEMLYGWSDELANIDAELASLDAEIETLEGIEAGRASSIAAYIGRRGAEELAPLQQELADLEAKQAGDVELTTEETDRLAEIEAELASLQQEQTALQTKVDEGTELTAEESERLAQLETDLAPLLQEQAILQGKQQGLTAEDSERLFQVQTEIAAFEEAIKPYEDLSAARAASVERRSRFQALVDAHDRVKIARADLALAEAGLEALGEAPAEGGDPNARAREVLTNQQAAARDELEAADAERSKAYQALLDAGDILPYDPSDETNVNRLSQVGWTGTLYAFLEGTLVGGRPTSGAYWPQPMPNWSQETGGPLRPDQIRYLVEFILAWDKEFTIEDLRAVEQFAKIPSEGGAAPEGPTVGSNITLIAENLTALREGGEFEANAATGQSLFESTYACAGCHQANAGTGPALTDLFTRAMENQDDRLTATGNEENPEGYLIQSIVDPNAYIVPGFAEGIMPPTFGDRMTVEELAHILAYLEEQQ